jgi:metal-dependent amidase/aminoacylase/carboxypeptidase family protein
MKTEMTEQLFVTLAGQGTALSVLRRELHAHPELAFQEAETAGIIARRLRAAGVDVREGVAQTGVVGVVRGARGGRCILVRADIDALPILEANAVPYRSQVPGVMHA